MSNNEEEIQESKVRELCEKLTDLTDRELKYCSDSCLRKFLTARSGNVKKAERMLRETLQWRADYKPEEIRWEDIAGESATGKLYKAEYVDKSGRPVLVMRPGLQNTSAPAGQIKQLVYFMENAILSLPAEQDKMVWLIDFSGWSVFKSPSVKTTQDIAYILQTFYPERLGLAILYNPPYIFETFWLIVKHFLDPGTCKKVKFVYSKDVKLLHDVFDMSKVEAGFGGGGEFSYNHEEYGKVMRQEDLRADSFWGVKRLPSSCEGNVESV